MLWFQSHFAIKTQSYSRFLSIFTSFPLGLIISSGFMQMPVLNEGKHLLLHLNLAWSGLLWNENWLKVIKGQLPPCPHLLRVSGPPTAVYWMIHATLFSAVPSLQKWNDFLLPPASVSQFYLGHWESLATLPFSLGTTESSVWLH